MSPCRMCGMQDCAVLRWWTSAVQRQQLQAQVSRQPPAVPGCIAAAPTGAFRPADSPSGLNKKIAELKAEQTRCLEQKKQLAKDLRNAERKRARQLTDEDLVAVLILFGRRPNDLPQNRWPTVRRWPRVLKAPKQSQPRTVLRLHTRTMPATTTCDVSLCT